MQDRAELPTLPTYDKDLLSILDRDLAQYAARMSTGRTATWQERIALREFFTEYLESSQIHELPENTDLSVLIEIFALRITRPAGTPIIPCLPKEILKKLSEDPQEYFVARYKSAVVEQFVKKINSRSLTENNISKLLFTISELLHNNQITIYQAGNILNNIKPCQDQDAVNDKINQLYSLIIQKLVLKVDDGNIYNETHNPHFAKTRLLDLCGAYAPNFSTGLLACALKLGCPNSNKAELITKMQTELDKLRHIDKKLSKPLFEPSTLETIYHYLHKLSYLLLGLGAAISAYNRYSIGESFRKDATIHSKMVAELQQDIKPLCREIKMR